MRIIFTLLLLTLSASAEVPYFIRPVSAAQLRSFAPLGAVPELARDTFQVFVLPQKADTRSVVVQLFTRRNGVDRTLTGAANTSGGWALVVLEVDEVFVNLEYTDIKITESPVALETASAALPLRVMR